MHLIPQSWAHLHILVSVFPSVGLLFALGFYLAALKTRNETLKRACLFVFGGLAVLGVPTYFSGLGSVAKILARPGVTQAMIDVHYNWSIAALAALAVTGAVAWFTLWRSWKSPAVPLGPGRLILGLSLLAVALMAKVGELGWEINHQEFKIPTPDMGTPEVWAHIHVILNHFPTIGFVLTLFVFITGLVVKNEGMQRIGLAGFVICAVLGVPTYVTGAGAMWALTDVTLPGVTQAIINAHRDWALVTLFGLAITGAAAWIELWRYRYIERFSKVSLYVVLVAALITLAVMAETGHRGGQINHPEIRILGQALRSDPNAGWTAPIELMINNVIWFVPWQTVHFFGYTLVFSVVLVVCGRVLGLWKSIPFSAVHRLLPLGMCGVIMNIFTGMLMLMADTSRYINEPSFWPKMFFLPIGAIAVLYFSLSDGLWAVKAGEDAPAGAKWAAGLVLLSWTIVIMGGRLLPYIYL